MSEQQVNIPLLRKAVEWAEAETAKPATLCEWVQDAWVAAATPQDIEQWNTGFTTSHFGKAEECGTCYCIAGYVTAVTSGPSADPWDVARTALRLTGSEADRLFEGDNKIADVRRIAESIAGERL